VEEWEGFRIVSMAYLTQQLRHLLSTRAKPYEWSLPTAYLPKPDQSEALARIWPMTVAEAEKSQFTQLLCAEQRCVVPFPLPLPTLRIMYTYVTS
jgi:hypothetical protein